MQIFEWLIQRDPGKIKFEGQGHSSRWRNDIWSFAAMDARYYDS